MTWILKISEQPPPENKATLNITSKPSGAKIYIDGNYAGVTPLTVQVTAGSHTVRAELLGYQPQTKIITCAAGQTCPVVFTLSPSPGPTPQINWLAVLALVGVSMEILGLAMIER